jgi:hypothetical protein
MTVLIVVLILLTVVVGFWHFGRKPAVHRQLTDEKLETLLAVLLNQGYDGGVLFIQGPKPVPFIQVMKYAGSKRVGLQLDFPKAPWAGPYLENVELAVQRSNVQQINSSHREQPGVEFLSLDFGTNVKTAAACVKRIAEEGLGLRLSTEGRAYFQNVSSDPQARIGFEAA